ncbi:hypothetical protein [Sphingomonas aurantiaca]|uniref:hypothetical protein n=1 Tax=Sphingomonas aurantiaca TaxID=185949 RepID=UPI00335F6898
MVLLIASMLLRPDDVVTSEVVVVAKSRKCDLAIGGRTMRDADFKRHAAEWAAGRPVRVVVPHAARTQCLAKIVFKLHDRGVTRAEFVDAPSPAPPRP